MADSLNIGKNMSGQQVIDAAQILFEEFPQMKVNDVVYCFNKAKRGHYGIIYDRLDVHVILGWLHRFDADQAEQVEYHRQRENNVLKRATKALPLLPDAADNETALKYINKIKDQVNKVSSAKQSKIDKVHIPHERFSKWLAQFNTVYARMYKTKHEPGGTRFVKRYGRMLDTTEFLKYKQYQFELAADRKFLNKTN